MPRNFGLSFEKLSSRPASSGAQHLQTGPHYSAETTRADSNVHQFPLASRDPSRRAWPNLRGGEEAVSSFIQDEREFGATCFAVSVALVPAFFLFALIFFGFALFDFG